MGKQAGLPGGESAPGYGSLLAEVTTLIEESSRRAVRVLNATMTATYWLIGYRIVESEQAGEIRAEYGDELVKRLSMDLSACYGRGYSARNLWNMRAFYLAWPNVADQRILQTASAESSLEAIKPHFLLPWSAYLGLLSIQDSDARNFYEAEALRGGWSVRQLRRQIDSQFYERAALSKDKAATLKKGRSARRGDSMCLGEAIKDPFVLEFLDLKDEYSESDLEEALIHHLEAFLLELGSDFCFIGRQKRLRVGDAWYRVDLIFFHRHLRCLVIIDLKIGAFAHADAGQMHLYLNYARENWTHESENPPVGLILCARKDVAVAHYALEGLPNQVMAAEYRTALPDEKQLVAELERTRAILEERGGPSRA